MKKKEETRSIRHCNLRENFAAASRRTSGRVCPNGLTGIIILSISLPQRVPTILRSMSKTMDVCPRIAHNGIENYEDYVSILRINRITEKKKTVKIWLSNKWLGREIEG